jgi:hypothetical protein
MAPVIPSGNLEQDGQELFSHLPTPESYHQDGLPARPSYENLFGEPHPVPRQPRHEPLAPVQRSDRSPRDPFDRMAEDGATTGEGAGGGSRRQTARRARPTGR